MATVSIPLHSRKYPGLFVIVDEEDYPLVSQYRWHPNKGTNTWYAATNIPNGDGTYHYTKMHRLILNAAADVEVDHWDGNGLNNTRKNLREATREQNLANVGPRKSNPTGYRGVSEHVIPGVWRAQIRANGERKQHLGLYATPEDAARAFDRAAWEAWGDFARLNFPDSLNAPPPKALRLRADNQSGYIGVKHHARKRTGGKEWQAVIAHDGCAYSLGYFVAIEDAARAYDVKARELLGEHATLNFPEGR